VTTNFVGELYEETNGAGMDFLFMGSSRIASFDGTRVRWFAGDHLGSTSVVLDETSAVKEKIEYTPWGEVKSYDNFGNTAEVAWFYFTGKKLDDETGLVFFGARYYNPKLGRFITADSVVQSPYDPQTLNRYSYCNNNPVNLVDPTGQSWGSFFKSLWETIEYVVNPVKSDPVVRGIVTGDWNYAQQMATVAVTSFVCSGFNPVVAAAAVMTEAVMRTPVGEWTAQETGEHVFDNALGMRPRTAQVWSAVSWRIGLSLEFEKMFATASGARPAQIKKNLSDAELDELSKGEFAGDETILGPSLRTRDAFSGRGSLIEGLAIDNKLVASYESTSLGIPFLREIGTRHSAANALNVSVQKINPLFYGTWGTCHQATNLTLLNAGVSQTTLTLEGSWSMYVTTAVYGNYGGQLGYRVYSGTSVNNEG
jgi:RHS repeat-associated protein